MPYPIPHGMGGLPVAVIGAGRWPTKTQLENTILIGLPLIGSILAFAHIATNGISWIEISAFLFLYLFVGLGLSLGFHRYFTHRSFETSPAFAFFLAALGTVAFQGPVGRWVMDHRRHHAFADRPGDCHSPFYDAYGRPISGWRSIWHSHIGWMFARPVTNPLIFGRDLLKCRIIRFISRTHLIWLGLSFLLPYCYGWALAWHGTAWITLLVGGCLRTSVLHNTIWAVSSVAHRVGTRDFKVADKSHNHWLLAVLTFGEGWHNGHHWAPRSHRAGLKAGQIDMCAAIITILERIGIVHHVVRKPIVRP